MSGLDIAAAAAQVVSVAFQIFGGCIEAYKLFHAAQRIGIDGDFLRIKIQIERDRLQRWADRIGLADAKPNERLNWAAIVEILRLQESILTSAEKLKQRYGLDLPDVEDGGSESATEKVEPGGLERILVKLRPELYHSADGPGIIAAANSPFKRLRWAVVGREKVLRVVGDLGSLNTDLERFLESFDREWLHDGMAALLRELLCRSTNVGELEELLDLLRSRSPIGEQLLSTVANSKRIRLVLGADKREDEERPKLTQQIISAMPVLKMLKESKLKSDRIRAGVSHAMYGIRPVIVEWRKSEDVELASLEKRMQHVALFLSSTQPSFAALRCMGLLAMKEPGTYGLVHELPPMLDMDPDAEYEHRTLHSLISTHRKASLATRFGIARRIAEAVLYLHTAGWLHKSIRSENIIFIASSSATPDTFLNGTPYLIGYGHSRPEAQKTITVSSDVLPSIELYQHPDRRGAGKLEFRKRHDLFALACMLIEMALWEPLVDSISRHTGKDWKTAIEAASGDAGDLKLPSLYDISSLKDFHDEIVHAVGPAYQEAVRLCLLEEGDEVDDVSTVLQSRVVDCLRRCNV